MTFFSQFKIRSNEEEIMDDLDMSGKVLEEALDALNQINWWLGGNEVLKVGIKKIIQQTPSLKNKTIRIADVGCGGGDGLRSIAKWAKKNNINVELIGIDANQFTIDYARQHSLDFKNIQYKKEDILAKDFNYKNYDIVVFALFLHHFTDEEQLQFVQKCWRDDVQVVLINDLHRHWLAYVLFQLVCFVFRASQMVQYDGSLSIKKSFKRADFQQLIKKSKASNASVQWKWAFRWQAIIYGRR